MGIKQKTNEWRKGLSDLVAKVAGTLDVMTERWGKGRLKKGLRCKGGSRLKYGVDDILSGKVEGPSGNYEVGGYMQMANRFLDNGLANNDIEVALTGVRIFEWLGQGERDSLRRKMQRVYDGARAVAKEYGVPFSSGCDRSRAVVSSGAARELGDYFERNPLVEPKSPGEPIGHSPQKSIGHFTQKLLGYSPHSLLAS